MPFVSSCRKSSLRCSLAVLDALVSMAMKLHAGRDGGGGRCERQATGREGWRGGVGSKLVLKEPQLAAVLGPVIHAYWLQKRQKLGKPLLRRFWPATSPTDSNPHCVFRPREKERYKLRKHRKNDVDAFRKLQQLRRDFETARDLCALARRRETVRRLRGDASRGRLRRALDTLAKQRGVEALPDAFPFADQDDDYRLTPNEVAAATKALADAEAAKKAQAQKDLEQFYAERDAKVKARVAVNREEEKQYVAERDATVQEDSWESVAKMVNLKEVAGADTTRMRNVLIGLKHK